MFRTEVLESVAAPTFCSMGCFEMLLAVPDGVRGPGNPPFAAWSVVYHCLLQPEHRFSFSGKLYLLVRL